MDALEALKTRRSVRAYSMRRVPAEVLEELVNCARLAPSAMNLQPCEFVVITDPEVRAELAELCDYGTFIAEAPACIMVVARPEGHYLEDAACAATYLMVAARAHELGSCWVHAHDKPYEHDLGDLVGVPKELRVICLIAVGHGELPPPPPKRELAEVLHRERYSTSG